VIEKFRIEAMYRTLSPALQLKMLKADLLRGTAVESILSVAEPAIKELEDALNKSHTLDGFQYNPIKREMNPSFSPEEEEYARGGLFALI